MKLKWVAAFALLATAMPASAQRGSDVDAFVSAIKERDGDKAVELIRDNGSIVLNGRSYRGETGLIVAISERMDNWTAYLLQQGADPNTADGDGNRPLIAAARIGYADAVEWLLAKGADVNGTNRMGETPLIVAVQQRRLPVVKMLLANGADPDITDNAAGYSARDYAKRDTRTPEILEVIEETTKTPAAEAKTLDDFKLR